MFSAGRVLTSLPSAFRLQKVRGLQLGGRGGGIKVLLLEKLTDGVVGSGSAGEIVNVKRGYARNFLIPRKKAVYNTEANREKYSAMIANSSRVADNDKAAVSDSSTDILEKLATIGSHVFSFDRKATAEGSLFGSASAQDITEELSSKFGIALPVTAISMPESTIKTIGEHSFEIDGVSFAVQVSAEAN